MSTSQNKNSKHNYFMNLALMHARKSLGNTESNPSVGCVIVKNNSLIAAGSTGFHGTPHAEENAITFNKKDVKNSELYTTLEPCSNYGKTPPCVKKIINSKIKKVFFSINDPDTRSFKKSKKQLKKNNIYVKNNINYIESYFFYRSYIKSRKNSLPFVTAKLAVSNDFFTVNKKKQWITNKYSRGRVHLLRSHHDSLLTSSNTIIKDNPKLTCRINGLENTSPVRIILDKNLRIPVTSNVVTSAKKNKTIIFFDKDNLSKIKKMKNLGVRLIRIPCYQSNSFNLKRVLKKIKSLGFSRIFLESGLKLTEAFLLNSLVDDFYLFVSNNKLGLNGKNSFRKNMKFFKGTKKILNNKVNLLGDSLLSFRLK